MITFYWNYKDTVEIASGSTIPARGKFIIRVHRGSKNLAGYYIEIKDPFNVTASKYEIPQVKRGEYYQIAFPLGNYLHSGNYKIEIKNTLRKLVRLFEFRLNSRKKHTQSFLAEHKILVKGLRGKAKMIKIARQNIPENFLLQTPGEVILGRSTKRQNGNYYTDDIFGYNQKTISWAQIIQPSYLSINPRYLINYPDEGYVLNNRFKFDPEPGLQTNHPKLQLYNGSTDTTYPLRIIKDVLNFVHRNVKYIRQQKERGAAYALEKGKGDCTEYVALFVTLLRYLGIRARMVSGMGRSQHNYWISHAFAEVWIYGNWIPIDVVKQPKPYMQLGNRGDLIGMSRRNWLDSNKQEVKVEITGLQGEISPHFYYSRKVTESGKNKKNIQVKKPRKQLIQRNRKHLILKYHGDKIIIHKYPENTSSVLVIEGSLYFGSIVIMSQPNLGKIPIFDLEINKNEIYSVIALDQKGRLLTYSKLQI